MRQNERGFMLVWALITAGSILSFLYVGGILLRSSARAAETDFRAQGQALDIARAGLVDAHAWFRRQSAQPVTSFTPIRDLAATPPINETDDPAVGLVREFEISPGFWGRYEVRPYADANQNGRIDPGEGVGDVTNQRSLTGSGAVWQLDSQGFVYRQVDPAVPWNQQPNYRVSRAVVSTEVKRITLSVPGAGALCCDRGDYVSIGNKGKVDGGEGAAVLYAPLTGSPSVSGDVIGILGSVPDYDGSVAAVFGVSLEELKSMVDLRLPGGTPIPNPIPDYSLVLIEGDHVVTDVNPLRGTGIILVDGDLTLADNSNSYFIGLIYVTGSYTQRAPSVIRGVVVANGSASVSGVGDLAELSFDQHILNELRGRMGRYRLSRVLQRMDGGHP